MLPKPYRLAGHRMVAVFKSSQTFHSSFFVLKVLKKNQPETQLGFNISAKTCRLAVDRNKLKRQLRQAVKTYLGQLKPNREIIVLAKPPLKNLSFAQIQVQLQSLLQQAQLINETLSP